MDAIKHSLLSVLVFLLWIKGSSLTEKVKQTPASMWKRPGQQAEISCSHSETSYNQINWYKQSNRELEFLGYMVGTSAKPEDGA
ncbi:hypothetical protein INR49_031392, partial [Caranx melampygus]